MSWRCWRPSSSTSPGGRRRAEAGTRRGGCGPSGAGRPWWGPAPRGEPEPVRHKKERNTMGARAEKLAARFERVNEELIAEVEGCSEARWRSTTPEEGWPLG